MVKDKALYREITEIAEDYFGPAAPRFINKIIENHLRKDPEDVTPADMPELVTWVSVTVGVMTDEQTVVTEFTNRLNTLSHPS